jgi:peptidoglycan/LPS O-acetylase OafA/YrhL
MILLAPIIRYFLFEYYLSRTTPLVAADAVYWNTLSHLDAFFMGGLIPVFALSKKINKPGRFFILALVLVLIAGMLNYFNSNGLHSFVRDLGYSHDVVGNYAHVWRYSLLNLFFASFILLLTSKQVHLLAWVRKIFENEILVKIGRVSYGMYIFHWLIYVYIFARYLKFDSYYLQLLVFLSYVLAVYLVAALSFRFYESYFISLKDRVFVKNKTIVPESKG